MGVQDNPTTVDPFIRWAGSKLQLRPAILRRIPPVITGTYWEPFLGGGSIALGLLSDPGRAQGQVVLGDINQELINLYETIRTDTDQVILGLSILQAWDSPEYYKTVRDQDLVILDRIQRAARFLYINGAAWHGLYRTNSTGGLNAPYDHKDRIFPTPIKIRTAAKILNQSRIGFRVGPAIEILNQAQIGDFVYLDPPYIPRNKTATFTGYAAGGFSTLQQIELAVGCRAASDRGVSVLVSNSDTESTREIYEGGIFDVVNVRYGIGYESVKEVLISFKPTG